MSLPQISRIIGLVTCCFAGVGVLGAQDNESFKREQSSLAAEKNRLITKCIDLRIRQDANDEQKKKLTAESQRINSMPDGIQQRADLQAYNRALADWGAKCIAVNNETITLAADAEKYFEDRARLARKMRAANGTPPAKTPQFRVGEVVRAKVGNSWILSQISKVAKDYYEVEVFRPSIRGSTTTFHKVLPDGIRRP